MKKAKIKATKEVEKQNGSVNYFSVKRLIIMIVVMLVILVAFYFLTDFIVKKQKNNNSEPIEMENVREKNDINYDMVKDMVATSYYLLINAENDEQNANYDAYINLLNYFGLPIQFYYIDLAKEENKSLLADKSNLEDLNNLKVKETTLLYVQDGKIKESYEGSEKVLEYLTSFFAQDTTDDSEDQAEAEDKTTDENASDDKDKDKE